MIPIKFRARDIDSGEFVYGDLFHDAAGKVFIIKIALKESLVSRVEPDSVEQLVGYDTDGKEIYAGDTSIDEYVAQLRPCVVRKTPLGEDIHFDVDAFKLKEETP